MERISKIFAFIAWILLVITFSVLFIMYGTTFFGFKSYTVSQDNMAPSVNVGDLVVCQTADVNNIAIGNNVVFLSNYGATQDRVNNQLVERIIEVDTNSLTVRTKSDNVQSERGQSQNSGDSNRLSAETTAISALEGKVVLCAPLLGSMNIFLQSFVGVLILVLYFLLLIFLIIWPTKYKAAKIKIEDPIEYGKNARLRGTNNDNVAPASSTEAAQEI